MYYCDLNDSFLHKCCQVLYLGTNCKVSCQPFHGCCWHCLLAILVTRLLWGDFLWTHGHCNKLILLLVDWLINDFGPNKLNEDVLCSFDFDHQTCMFKVAMLANIMMTMKLLYIVNSLIWLWKTTGASWVLWIDMFEYLKVVEIVVVQVFESVEDEHKVKTH
jgi:hypothetical protein